MDTYRWIEKGAYSDINKWLIKKCALFPSLVTFSQFHVFHYYVYIQQGDRCCCI